MNSSPIFPIRRLLRLVRAVSCFLVAACWMVAGSKAADQGRPVKVFLFAGQSNMEGADARAERIDDYPAFKGAGLPQTNVLFCQLGGREQVAFPGWGPLQPGRSFGSELTFARMLQRHDDAPMAIIKSAVGGTTVAFDWNPSAPTNGQRLYPRTLQLVRDALRELERRGVRYQLEGVMWHQGENDMLDRRLNTNYAAGLRTLIARLRADLKAPELKWYLAEVSEKGIWGMDNRRNLAILRQQQDEVLKSDPLLRWVPTSHLAFEVMGSGQPHYHFGTQGQLQMGEAFAAAYLQNLGRKPAAPARSFPQGLPVAKGTRVHLVILAGQRNMEGEDAFVAELPIAAPTEGAALAASQNNVLFRYSLGGGVTASRDWEPLGPVGDLGNFGPELSMGARLRKSIPAGEGVAVVKFTHSGAQGPDWLPQGSPESRRELYPKFIAFVRAAVDDLTARGCDVRLGGVFWHTGENDTYFGPYRQKYAGWMRDLIARVRLDLGQPELPWFISEQHPRAIWRNMEAMNASLRTMAGAERAVVIIPTATLAHGRLHFGTQGTLQLGDAMAEAYLKARP